MKNNLTSYGRLRFEQEALSVSASSDPLVALQYLASGETQDRPGSVLLQKSVHIDDDVQISALDAFYKMDGRNSRYIGEVSEWYREEDAGDLKRNELNHISTASNGKFEKVTRRS